MTLGVTTSARAPSAPDNHAIRVMVVDDSVVVRGLVSRWLAAVPDIEVVASHRNGLLAVNDVAKSQPDVVVLDIEMPEMDGLTALPKMLAINPNLKIIMASTLTRRNAETSLRALSLGASDYVPKPETNSGVTTSEEFRRELSDKVVAIGRAVKSQIAAAPVARPDVVAPATDAAEQQTPRAAPAAKQQRISLRSYNAGKPRILVIGSSTGGPQALFEVTKSCVSAISGVPVVITQHMPPTFTAILSEHIAKSCGAPCKEAEQGERLLAGHIYVAPGGSHLSLVSGAAGGVCAQLDDGPPINFCKPAVDPMFESACNLFGRSTLAVILTGMGADGRNGARCIADAGGNVIAQDRETSVVWGMPGAAAEAGVCCAVLPLPQIGPRIVRALSGVG